MKKFSFLMIAAAGLLLNACSDETVNADGGGGNEGGVLPEGYVSLNINLPTTPSTRAENDKFGDGTTNEYEVHDCALLLFQGSNESGATLFSFQSVVLPTADTNPDKQPYPDSSNNDNVTTTYTAVAAVDGLSSGNNLYALVLLNYTKVLSFSADGKAIFAGTELSSQTLSQIRNLTISADLTSRGNASDYFFMANAVLSKVKGGELSSGETVPTASDIFQLVELDKSKIAQTPEAAKEEPAGNIYVERAVAKATLTVNSTTATKINATNDDGKTDANLTIKESVWTIDNIEPTTYVLRNPGNLGSTDLPDYIGYSSKAFESKGGNYRFVGEAPLKNAALGSNGSIPAYRTYWCVDPQYNFGGVVGTHSTGMLPVLTDGELIPAPKYAKADGTEPLYCNENTFDVDHQSYRNTTRAIIEVTLENSQSFYSVNGDGKVYTYENAVKQIKYDLITNTDVIQLFQDYYTGTGDYYVTEDDIEVVFEMEGTEPKRDENTGQILVTSLKLSSTFDKTNFKENFETTFNTEVAKTGATDIVPSINKRVVVVKYEKGKMYYEARFKHFAGNAYITADDGTITSYNGDLAPWNTKETWENPVPAGGTVGAAYPASTDRDRNYLGRYGMVRNNWYDVEVTAFNRLGLPVDPSGKITGDNTPDDDIQEYISVKINVLSWAKRSQSWSF